MAKKQELNTSAGITQAIKSIHNRTNTVQEDIQKVAVAICEHVQKHHEVSLINNLCDGMPKGIRVNALKDFFVSYAKCTYNEEEKTFKPLKDTKHVLPEVYTNWYEFKPEPEYKPFDLNAKIQALIKQAKKAAKKENEQDTINPATLTALSTLVEV